MLGFFRKTTCQKTQEKLSEYLDGRLAPEERESIEHHVEACPECRRELESLRATLHLLHRVPVSPAPRSFAIAEVKPAPRPVLRPGWLRLGTAVAVVALAFLFISDATGVLGPGLVGPEPPTDTSNYSYLVDPSQDKFADQSSADSQQEEQLPAGAGDLSEGAYSVGESVSSGGAGTWLGALEIGFSALVAILGGLTVLFFRQKRRRLKAGGLEL